MGASLTLDATTIERNKKGTQNEKVDIPIARVTVYDVEQRIKDGFTIDAFNKMMRRRGNLVILNDEWVDKQGNHHNKRAGKCVDNVVTILDGITERVYKITNTEMLSHFAEVCAESIDADHKSFNVAGRDSSSHSLDTDKKKTGTKG
jgi:hypothetical protein